MSLEKNRNYNVHINKKVVSLKNAQFLSDGTVKIDGQIVVSSR